MTKTAPQIVYAIERVRSGEPFGIPELVDTGILYWINRQAMHPLGYKLLANEDGSLVLVGDGKQKIAHDLPQAQMRNDALVRTLAPVGREAFDWFQKNFD